MKASVSQSIIVSKLFYLCPVPELEICETNFPKKHIVAD